MNVLGIDPGCFKSALVFTITDPFKVIECLYTYNSLVKAHLKRELCNPFREPYEVVCEGMAYMGQPAGREMFETAYWIGRFWEACEERGAKFQLVNRVSVKTFWCGNVKAKDANIRQAVFDRYGSRGTKKAPGPLYPLYSTGVEGATSHLISALAIAGYYSSSPPGKMSSAPSSPIGP